MNEVIQHANRGGYLLGICNGFQILCEAGLVPGALLHNQNQLFVCENVHLRVESTNSMITNKTSKGDILKIPIAHAEGRYYIDSDGLKSLYDNDQVLFKYCDNDGNTNESSNPNGSIDNIAGVCNADRNIFGMMPHPERAADENLGNIDGRILFQSILNEIEV